MVDEQGGIQYEPKPLNEISTLRKNTGDVDMNGKRLTNLSSVPGLDLDEILATPNVAVNVSTMVEYNTASLALNTAYCGPLFSTMNVKGKRVTNAADPELILEDDPAGAEKASQLVTQNFFNQHALTTAPDDRENYFARNKYLFNLRDAFVYRDEDVKAPDELEQGVFNVDEELVAFYDKQAINLGTMIKNTISLDYETRTNFDAKNKQVFGLNTDPLDNL